MNDKNKKLLRNSKLDIRNSIPAEEVKNAEQQVMLSLLKLSQFTQAKNIFCYLSFRSEVPTESVVKYCLNNDKNIYVPICVSETKEMAIAQYNSNTKLITSSYGVREPSTDTLYLGNRNELDLVILPGAVFDSKGYRIGYGAGYYDKFFIHTEKQIYKLALAFSFQMVDEVPKDAHDVPVDCIVTEKDIHMCSSN